METIQQIWNQTISIFDSIPSMNFYDILDIAIVAFLVYKLIIIVKNTRAWTLFKGILVIFLGAAIAYFFQLNTVLWIFTNTFSVGVIAIIIIFQPELRTALEKIGTGNMLTTMFHIDDIHKKNEYISIKTIDEIIAAIKYLSEQKLGAIIIVQQDVKLGEYETTGIKLNATVSSELLINIFEKNTPLHDGAAMIRDNLITYATCYLPLTTSMAVNKKHGTRHRAAIGITEISDAIAIVVSEETGFISLCVGGELKYNIDKEHIRNEFISMIKSKKLVKIGFSKGGIKL